MNIDLVNGLKLNQDFVLIGNGKSSKKSSLILDGEEVTKSRVFSRNKIGMANHIHYQ